MKPDKPHFSAGYTQRLQEQYGLEIAYGITTDWQYADLNAPVGESIPYVRVNKGASRPVLYVPGFTEGIIAKAPFAADLASHGHDVILPDQNRKEILRDTVTGRKDATITQARNYLAVLDAEGLLDEGPVDFVTHSYGSLIFDAMQNIAQNEGMTAFDGSHVVMLAPAGFADDETILRLGRRFIAMNRAEAKTPKQYGEFGGEMLKAGVKNTMANVIRATREGLHLANRNLDARTILSRGAANLALVSYGEDPLYSDIVLEPAIGRAIEDGASWSVPVAFDLHGPRGTEGASHNDEQFNPSRVAPVVSRLLRSDS